MSSIPTFIFSAGPRSGSTLLQRLVISSEEILVWGETAGGLNHILRSMQLLEVSLRPSSRGGGHGSVHYAQFIENKLSPTLWVANMQPPLNEVIAAYANFFEQLYGIQARKLGFSRWGIKEVRCTAVTCQTLRFLFPDCRFVFLVRNPLACLRSIKQRNYGFLDNWGMRRGQSPLVHFATIWASIASDFKKLPDSLVIRYEDLISGSFSTDSLCEYLRIDNVDTALITSEKVDWTAGSPTTVLTVEEIQSVMPILSKGMKDYKYE